MWAKKENYLVSGNTVWAKKENYLVAGNTMWAKKENYIIAGNTVWANYFQFSNTYESMVNIWWLYAF